MDLGLVKSHSSAYICSLEVVSRNIDMSVDISGDVMGDGVKAMTCAPLFASCSRIVSPKGVNPPCDMISQIQTKETNVR